MKWKKYTIDTTTAAIDFISEMLDEKGVEGIEIVDNVPLTESETKGMFIDILLELPPDDGSAKVSFYLDYEMPEEKRQPRWSRSEKAWKKSLSSWRQGRSQLPRMRPRISTGSTIGRSSSIPLRLMIF